MTKFAHIGDIHIDQADKHNALEEQVQSLCFLGEDAFQNGAQFFAVAGDVFEKKSDIQERNAAIEVFTGWASLAPVVIVRGNHDRPNDLSFLGKLKTDFPIVVCEVPQTIQIEGCNISLLPWPNKAQLVQALKLDNQLDTHNAAEAALKGILEGFKVHKAQNLNTPSILLGHVELGGANMDSGQPVSAQADFVLNKHDLLDLGLDYYALGHIHLHQIVDGKLCYAGSTRQNTFGEEGPKGYCLVNVDCDSVQIEHREIPYRKLVDMKAVWNGSSFDLPEDQMPYKFGDDAKVKFQYKVDSTEKEKAYQFAKELTGQWPNNTTIDPKVTQTHRVRSEQIQKAKTTEDKVKAFWEVTQTPARQARILEKLSVLEGEVVA